MKPFWIETGWNFNFGLKTQVVHFTMKKKILDGLSHTPKITLLYTEFNLENFYF